VSTADQDLPGRRRTWSWRAQGEGHGRRKLHVVPPAGHLVELDGEQCWHLLRGDTLGRIVYTYQALPAVVPVNYAVLGESVLVRTSPHSRLGQLGDGAVVAFEVDSIDRARRTGWSVVLVGSITVLDHAPEGMEDALRLLGAPWTVGAEGVTLRIMPGFITGRDVRRAP
jgi:hypothetical protein